jgi:hypothetical protein
MNTFQSDFSAGIATIESAARDKYDRTSSLFTRWSPSQPLIWPLTTLSENQRRLLEMLDGAGARGCPEALVLANGFDIELLTGLVRAGLASVATEIVRAAPGACVNAQGRPDGVVISADGRGAADGWRRRAKPDCRIAELLERLYGKERELLQKLLAELRLCDVDMLRRLFSGPAPSRTPLGVAGEVADASNSACAVTTMAPSAARAITVIIN